MPNEKHFSEGCRKRTVFEIFQQRELLNKKWGTTPVGSGVNVSIAELFPLEVSVHFELLKRSCLLYIYRPYN